MQPYLFSQITRATYKMIDDKDAKDVPELTVGKTYYGTNNDGDFVDIFDLVSLEKVGTYCVGRFQQTQYNVVNGTYYHLKTPAKVVEWLETSRERKQRIRLFLGDADTGRDWMEENDVMGHIHRSTGPIKIPILIARSSSKGGGSVLDHCIVRIMTQGSDGKWVDVYRHREYHHKKLIIQASGEPEVPVGVWALGEPMQNVANFKTRKQAERWIDFMTGNRMTK